MLHVHILDGLSYTQHMHLHVLSSPSAQEESISSSSGSVLTNTQLVKVFLQSFTSHLEILKKARWMYNVLNYPSFVQKESCVEWTKESDMIMSSLKAKERERKLLIMLQRVHWCVACSCFGTNKVLLNLHGVSTSPNTHTHTPLSE